MKNYFSQRHPAVILAYFLCAVIVTILFSHPAVTIISFLSVLLLSLWVNGFRCMLKDAASSAVTILIFTVVSPLFNHRGDTPVLYVNNRPVTLESILFGVFSGMLISGMVVWFSIWHKTLGNDKFIYLLGRKFPQSSLLITMMTGFIPYFRLKLAEITGVQKKLGVNAAKGNLSERLQSAGAILSVLVSITLEDTMETADSMAARGYSLSNKTSRGFYRFKKADVMLVAVIGIMMAAFIIIYISRDMEYSFFPAVTKVGFSDKKIIYLGLCFLFFNIALAVNIAEEVIWKLLK